MKYFLIWYAITSLIGVSRLHALPIDVWKSATVKVESYPCHDYSRRLIGTGIVVRVDREIFVLTSEHVILNDISSATCHQVGDLKLNLVSADISFGLALLKPIQTDKFDFEKRAISLDSFSQLSVNSSVAIIGFPVDSTQQLVYNLGIVQNPASSRGQIPSVEGMIEANGMAAEFGFSGGPLLHQVSPKSWEFAGIVSHQALKRFEGKPVVTQNVSGNLDALDLTLSIPGEKVLSWVQEHSKNVPRLQGWGRLSEDQLMGRDSISYGPLIFRETKSDNFYSSSLLEAKAIGGRRIVGGGDGAGVGGLKESDIPRHSRVTIEVLLNPNADIESKSMTIENATLDKWRQWLLAGYSVRITFLSLPGESALAPIQSVTHFLKLWKNDRAKAIAVRMRGPGDFKLELSQLEEASRRAQKSLRYFEHKIAEPKVKRWIFKLRDICLLSENLMVLPSELDFELRNKVPWNIIYSLDFDKAVELEEALSKIHFELKQVL